MCFGGGSPEPQNSPAPAPAAAPAVPSIPAQQSNGPASGAPAGRPANDAPTPIIGKRRRRENRRRFGSADGPATRREETGSGMTSQSGSTTGIKL